MELLSVPSINMPHFFLNKKNPLKHSRKQCGQEKLQEEGAFELGLERWLGFYNRMAGEQCFR